MLILRGLEDLATTMGFSVFLCNSYDDSERERSHLEALLAKQVDGLVLSSGYKVRQRVGPAAATGNTPLVYAYQYTKDVAVHCVLPDDFGGGEIAAKHLVEVGRRRIAVIAGPRHYDASTVRLNGARHALRQCGLTLPPRRVRRGPKWHEDVGYDLATQLMKQDPSPDGLFCMSDNLAVGALGALRELRFNVPNDVSLVGFDDRYGAAHTRPPLTTVALPLYEIGKFAGQLLIEQVTGQAPPPESPTLHRLPCSLVERGSSRPTALTGRAPEAPSTTLRASRRPVVVAPTHPRPRTHRSIQTSRTGGS
jgi:LacI family transcriptional regulator